jgi:hypothetical protein
MFEISEQIEKALDHIILQAIIGLRPEKEKHEFFVDVAPEFGFPLAIRYRVRNEIVRFRGNPCFAKIDCFNLFENGNVFTLIVI